MCDKLSHMSIEISYMDIIDCVGATSKRMSQILSAFNGKNPKSFDSMLKSGKIDIDDYYQYNDRIGVMIEKINGETRLHFIVMEDDDLNNLTHYVIATDTVVKTIKSMRNNSNYTGVVLSKRESAEHCVFAKMYIYKTSKCCSFLTYPGKCLAIVSYSFGIINGKTRIFMQIIPRKSSNIMNLSKLQISYPLPKNVEEKIEFQRDFDAMLGNLFDDNDDLNKN